MIETASHNPKVWTNLLLKRLSLQSWQDDNGFKVLYSCLRTVPDNYTLQGLLGKCNSSIPETPYLKNQF
jgi:hypothetical protein